MTPLLSNSCMLWALGSEKFQCLVKQLSSRIDGEGSKILSLKKFLRRILGKVLTLDMDLYSASTRKNGLELLGVLRKGRAAPIATMAVSMPTPYLTSLELQRQVVSVSRLHPEKQSAFTVSYPGLVDSDWSLGVPARYSVQLSNAVIDLKNNVCCVRIPVPELDGQRLVALSGFLDNGNTSFVSREVFSAPLDYLDLKESEVAIAPGGQSDPNHFHWLHNWLPAFLALVTSSELLDSNKSVVFPYYGLLPGKVGEVLGYFPHVVTRRVPVPVISVERFQYIDPSHQLYFSDLEIRLLHDFADSYLNRPSREPLYERIFISRTRSSRTLPFEAMLENLLQSKLGFQVIHAQDFSLCEQQRLFRHARVVVGFHGAGLSNMIWCRDEVLIIEIARSSYAAPYFAMDANCLGFEHRLIWHNEDADGDKVSSDESLAHYFFSGIRDLIGR